MQLLLKEGFEVREGSEVSVQSVLAYLGLGVDSQKLVSRAVKEIFPGIQTRREDKKGIKQYPFNLNKIMTKVLIFKYLVHLNSD